MSIGLYQVRSHEVVRQYEHHWEYGDEQCPDPNCGEAWSEPSPIDRSRTLEHKQGCDFMKWLHEPDPFEDEGY